MLRTLEQGREERGYLVWEGTAVYAGWLGKASFKKITFEQKAKRSEGANYAYVCGSRAVQGTEPQSRSVPGE